jgi:hypothetical protein
LQARTQIETYNVYTDALRAKQRTQAKLKIEGGITFIPLEINVRYYREQLQNALSSIVETGEKIFFYLDAWQEAGATLRDLCDLCAKPYHQAVQEIGPDRLSDQFSGIMFVHCLDYQHDFSGSNFFSMTHDAPFTHCIKEYMIYKMKTNPVTKAAADVALRAIFPEIWEKAFYIHTDEDGTERNYDRDGIEIDPAAISPR